MFSLKKKKTKRKKIPVKIPKEIEEKFKVLENVDITKFPYNADIKIDLKNKDYEKPDFMYRASRWAAGVVNKHPWLDKIRRLFETATETYVKETHFPYPSYSYSSLFAIVFLIMIILLPLSVIGLLISKYIFLILLTLIILALSFMTYMYVYPKSLASKLSEELGDILLMWYSVSRAGMTPQQQIKILYLILENYRQINNQLRGKMPFYNFYYVFKDLYYDIELKNISIVNALERQVKKIKDEKVKTFFLRLIRALRSGVDISEVIKDELEKYNTEVLQDIQKMGEKLYNVLQIYNMFLVMVIGMISIIKVSLSSMIGTFYVIQTMSTFSFFMLIAPVGLSIIVYNTIKTIKRKYAREKDYKVPIMSYLLSLASLILVLFVLPIVGVTKISYLLTLSIALILSISSIMVAKRIRKKVENLEDELPSRLAEVSSIMNMGVRVSDAFRSGVSTEEYENMDYGDMIFLYISSYMNMGKQLIDIFYKFIIKIPSKLFRITFGLISFTEEVSGNFGEFMSVISDLINRKLENIKMSESTLSIIKFSIPITTIVMFIIIGISILMIQPILKQMNTGGIFSLGGGGSNDEYSGLSVIDSLDIVGGPIGFGIKWLAPGRGTLGMQDDTHAFLVALYVFMVYSAIGFALSLALIYKVMNDYSIAETFAIFTIFLTIMILLVYPVITKSILDPNAKTIIDTLFSNNMNIGTLSNTTISTPTP